MENFLENQTLDQLLLETKLPTDAQNLRRKIESISRNIENLSAKKLSLELEIKSQKRVLARKRLELKKRSKSNTIKLKAALEQATEPNMPKNLTILQAVDQKLLRESARLLEE